MSFLRRLWNYSSTGAQMKIERAMDPAIEIE